MKKLVLSLLVLVLTSTSSFAQQLPKTVQDYIESVFPQTNFRFDGVVILPDNTMYLPVFPAKVNEVSQISIKTSYPKNLPLKNKPDLVILNNNYSFLKVINTNGKKTVINMTNPPEEISSGLLPQDAMLPKGLVFPAGLKGIIGDLDLSVTQETGLRINNIRAKNKQPTTPVSELSNKTFYIASGINKNIQVVPSTMRVPESSLAQNAIINDMKPYKGFLLVTYFDSKVMNIISLMDEKVIREIPFDNAIPEQILIDNENNTAYISAGASSSIYVFDLDKMILRRQLKINGICEKLTLSEDGSKIFYVDRNTNDIWAVELNNNYLLKNIGRFPNVSKIAFNNDKLYLISRTKNRLAIVDYKTMELIKELEVSDKPIDLYFAGDDLFVLCAKDNIVEVLNSQEDVITDKLFLNTESFATNITPIQDTKMIMITNAKSGLYSVVDTVNKDIVKTSPLDIPVRNIVVTNRVKTIK